MVTVSAPGKVILMGDHAVVYGKPALISTIDLRLKATISDSDKPEIIAEEGKSYIRHILTTLCNHFSIKSVPPLKIEITSDIPIGYHLGSSAALGASLVGGISYHLKKIWNPTLINQLAYKSEKFVHVNSSGVDPASVVSGGLIWYRKELDFLRSIWQFPFGIPASLHHFYFVDTGRSKETTGEMVAYVKSKINDQKTKIETLMNKNEEQTKRLAKAIKEGNEEELIGAIRTGERTLEGMGVVSKKAGSIIRTIELAGGAAKILGGGGRAAGVGFLLAYHHEPEKLAKKLKLKIQKIKLGEEGIKLEKHD